MQNIFEGDRCVAGNVNKGSQFVKFASKFVLGANEQIASRKLDSAVKKL